MTPEAAQQLLHAIAGPGATFRNGQLESIVSLVDQRARLLLV